VASNRTRCGLRKFVLATTDEVHVSRVLDSVEASLRPGASHETFVALREGFEQLSTWIRYVDESGRELLASHLIEDFIYGGLLHGDYDKWLRTRAESWVAQETALWQFTSEPEHFVRTVRDAIRSAERDELLT